MGDERCVMNCFHFFASTLLPRERFNVSKIAWTGAALNIRWLGGNGCVLDSLVSFVVFPSSRLLA